MSAESVNDVYMPDVSWDGSAGESSIGISRVLKFKAYGHHLFTQVCVQCRGQTDAQYGVWVSLPKYCVVHTPTAYSVLSTYKTSRAGQSFPAPVPKRGSLLPDTQDLDLVDAPNPGSINGTGCRSHPGYWHHFQIRLLPCSGSEIRGRNSRASNDPPSRDLQSVGASSSNTEDSGCVIAGFVSRLLVEFELPWPPNAFRTTFLFPVPRRYGERCTPRRQPTRRLVSMVVAGSAFTLIVDTMYRRLGNPQGRAVCTSRASLPTTICVPWWCVMHSPSVCFSTVS